MANDMIDQLKKDVGAYGQSLGEVSKLRIIGIVSRVMGLFLLMLTIVLMVFALLSFGAVAIINALSAHMPIWAAALIMGAMYILLIIVTFLCRKPLFVHPFIRLMSQQISSEEELALKTAEAEHRVEIQSMQLNNRVENATRDFSLLYSLIVRIWRFFVSRIRTS